MSVLSRQGRITVKPFASVPSLDSLPAIHRALPSVSNVSSFFGIEDSVDLAEGCLVTRTIRYTHQLVHWVNAVQSDDSEPIETVIEETLRVIPDAIVFGLDQPCNLAFLEPFVHTALDLYAFIAVTASLSTLDSLIDMVRSDNNLRQQKFDRGIQRRRLLNFSLPSFINPEYELVALHPEHFLPRGSMLTVYDPSTATYKHYVAAVDRYLRESSDPSSPRLPPFHHVSKNRDPDEHPNVFLAILNAEIKFHRYFKMIEQHPPTTPLPADVINLMQRTIELVDLLYWEPVLTKGSRGAAQLAKRLANRRKNPPGKARPDSAKTIESESREEVMEDDQNMQIPSGSFAVSSRRRRLSWFEDMDLETRKACGRALMSGHDREYDPALFEDAFPINDSHLYSDNMAVEAWQQKISSDPSETL